jgi:hypothetical protein
VEEPGGASSSGDARRGGQGAELISEKLRDSACVLALAFLLLGAARAEPRSSASAGPHPVSGARALVVPVLRAPQLGFLLMTHLQRSPLTQSQGLLRLVLFNGAAIYDSMRSPLPPTQAPAGIDPKHGSDLPRHIPFVLPLFFMPL